jgi:hypothetical protein
VPLAQPEAGLDWLVSRCGAAPQHLKIDRIYLGEELGWGMVALEDVEPDEVLLSVPLPRAISSEASYLARRQDAGPGAKEHAAYSLVC